MHEICPDWVRATHGPHTPSSSALRRPPTVYINRSLTRPRETLNRLSWERQGESPGSAHHTQTSPRVPRPALGLPDAEALSSPDDESLLTLHSSAQRHHPCGRCENPSQWLRHVLCSTGGTWEPWVVGLPGALCELECVTSPLHNKILTGTTQPRCHYYARDTCSPGSAGIPNLHCLGFHPLACLQQESLPPTSPSLVTLHPRLS